MSKKQPHSCKNEEKEQKEKDNHEQISWDAKSHQKGHKEHADRMRLDSFQRRLTNEKMMGPRCCARGSRSHENQGTLLSYDPSHSKPYSLAHVRPYVVCRESHRHNMYHGCTIFNLFFSGRKVEISCLGLGDSRKCQVNFSSDVCDSTPSPWVQITAEPPLLPPSPLTHFLFISP